MAGHSKWANIKHRKAAQDAKRGKIFTKLIRELVVAAKEGGGDPNDNPRLRAAIDKALGANMKKDTIEKAIDRGTGNADGDNYEELIYEGYGPGGVAILVECMTDNKNRTVGEVRHAFTKHGGNLGTNGSVAYLFEKKGQFIFADNVEEEALMEAALEAGAEDFFAHDDGSFELQTAPEDFLDVKDALVKAGFEPENAEVSMLPSTQAELGVNDGAKVIRLVDRLEELDDTQNVYTNADIPSESYDLV